MDVYRSDPIKFLELEFGDRFELSDPQQMQFYMRSTNPYRSRILEAVSSCTGPGKSAIIAVAALRFMVTMFDLDRGVFPKGLLLSDNEIRLKTVLLPEIKLWLQQSRVCKLLLKHTADGIAANDRELSSTWFLQTKLAPRTSEETKIREVFSGFHGINLFLGFDESGAMVPALNDGLRQVLTARNLEKFTALQAGNPQRVVSLLYRTKTDPLWNFSSITGDPDHPECSTRVDKALNRQIIAEYGYDSDLCRVVVRGLFPLQGSEAIFNTQLVEESMDRSPYVTQVKYHNIGGVDLHAGGMDKSFMSVRNGYNHVLLKQLYGESPEELAEQIIAVCQQYNIKGYHLNIDRSGGYGADVCIILKQQGQSFVPVLFNARPVTEETLYLNSRAYMIFSASRWIRDTNSSLYKDKGFYEEIIAHEKKESVSHSKLQVIPKDDIRALLNRSPDKFDSFILTFYRFKNGLQNEIIKRNEHTGPKRWDGFDHHNPWTTKKKIGLYA